MTYSLFLVRFNESYGSDCNFLSQAFALPRFAMDADSQPFEKAVDRRIDAIVSLTEAMALRPDSRLPLIRARLAAIEDKTFEGLANVCTADIASRNRKLAFNIDAIRLALSSLGNNRVSILELEQSEEEQMKVWMKTVMFTALVLFLLLYHAKQLRHLLGELWMANLH